MPILDEEDPHADLAESALNSSLRKLLGDADGRRVLFWILGEAGLYRDAFQGDNHAMTDYALGGQNIGRRIIGRMDALDARLYPKLLLDMADQIELDRRAAAAVAAARNEDDEDE